MSLSNLQTALEKNPDLASISRETVLNTYQMLFMDATISPIYFAGLGKSAFLIAVFYIFINGNIEQGSLSDNKGDQKGLSRISKTSGDTLLQEAPISICGLEICTKNNTTTQFNCRPEQREQNIQWYNNIRRIISDHICSEEERVPSM